jgi:1,5-anhydro-D-fructose reductase (1,5-anhydro-D-mannitol-forming)
MKIISGEVRWGIIGAGNVCEKKSGPAFNIVPDSQLAAVMRRNIDKARDFALRHNVPRFYDTADALISDKEVNAVYVATPPAFHEDYAMAAIKAGKPVYIEKPVALDAAGCERILAASVKYNIPVAIAHYRRRLPLFLKVRELIHSGRVGKIKLVTVRILQSFKNGIVADTEDQWRLNPAISGGGIFHDLAPHQLDLFYWLFGAPQKMSGHSLNQGRTSDAPDITVLEAIFKNDILLQGLWSFNISNQTREDCCEIFGDKGRLSFSFFRSPVLKIKTENEILNLEFPYPEYVQQPMIADVVQFFRGNSANPCPPEEALWTMRMLDSTKHEF